jgi:hypothetical protein
MDRYTKTLAHSVAAVAAATPLAMRFQILNAESGPVVPASGFQDAVLATLGQAVRFRQV